MITRFKEWLRLRKLTRRQRDYSRGYKWAIHELDNGQPPEYVRAYTYGNYDDFDRGANEALGEWLECMNQAMLTMGSDNDYS